MKRTFKSEDARKTHLFSAWNTYLEEVQQREELDWFDDVYEGLATITELSRNSISFLFDDGRKVDHVPISARVSEHSCRTDLILLALGYKDGEWWPLEVISIGSFVEGRRGGIHLTVNPLVMQCQSAQETLH